MLLNHLAGLAQAAGVQPAQGVEHWERSATQTELTAQPNSIILFLKDTIWTLCLSVTFAALSVYTE